MEKILKQPTLEDFKNAGVDFIDSLNEAGKKEKYVLLSDSRIAHIRKGKGADVERATMIAGKDNSNIFLQ